MQAHISPPVLDLPIVLGSASESENGELQAGGTNRTSLGEKKMKLKKTLGEKKLVDRGIKFIPPLTLKTHTDPRGVVLQLKGCLSLTQNAL